MANLSKKQDEILEYLKVQVIDKGYPPSVREICDAVSLKSTSTVHSHLSQLEKKGYIKRDPTKPRAIEILSFSDNPIAKDFFEVPIIGNIANGTPLLSSENIESYFPLSADYINHETIFMIRAKGDSMINIGINNQDLVIVCQQNHAKNGDIIVALIEDYATIKTFYKEKDFIRLQPENPNMSPIIVKDITILGKVVGLFRKF